MRKSHRGIEKQSPLPLGERAGVRGVVQNRCGPQRLSEVAVQKRGYSTCPNHFTVCSITFLSHAIELKM